MNNPNRPRGVHLVGSVPYEDCREVFRTISALLGDHIRRMPDGETGERRNWVDWQFAKLLKNPGLVGVANELYRYQTQVRMVKLRDGCDADSLALGTLGYSEAAIASYAVFRELKASGVIPARVRFQVSLPTPLSTTHLYVHPSLQEKFAGQYEAGLLQELQEITAAVPPRELAIQWDTAVEFMLLERMVPSYLHDLENDINRTLVRIGESVPASVELGYHLCYGDSGHKHFCEPQDTGKLVGVANRLGDAIGRDINWIHLPVPRERDDDGYYRPLQDLALQRNTELYLGLVHYTDGVSGTSRRIKAAQKYVTDFGVATECGFGRRPRETLADLMSYHIKVADPVV